MKLLTADKVNFQQITMKCFTHFYVTILEKKNKKTIIVIHTKSYIKQLHSK